MFNHTDVCTRRVSVVGRHTSREDEAEYAATTGAMAVGDGYMMLRGTLTTKL